MEGSSFRETTNGGSLYGEISQPITCEDHLHLFKPEREPCVDAEWYLSVFVVI